MDTSKADLRPFITGILKGVACATVCAAALIPLGAALLLMTPDPGRISAAAGYSILFLSAMTGGGFAARFTGDGILSGLIAGAVMSILVLLLSFIPVGWEKTVGGGMSLLLHLMPSAAGALGGLIFRRRAKKVRRRKRR